MAGIDITSGIAAAYGAGELQLQGKVQMTSTLTPVTDNLNIASPLLLSTTGVQITSPLRITTSDASGFYLDAEDAATNNRFSIKRDPSSQQVTLDFASNPSGSTTAVGGIRTFRDGVNLSDAMTFIEDGSVGINTTTPDSIFDCNGLVTISGGQSITLGLKALQLPTGIATNVISAGLSTRTDVNTIAAGESIIQMGNNLNTYYTGAVNAAKAGAMIRLDTRGVEPNINSSNYSVFQIQTRAAGVADPNYTVPVQIGAAPNGSFIIKTNGNSAFGGDVGIGTSTPLQKLNVALANVASEQVGLLLNTQNNSNGAGLTLSFGFNNGSSTTPNGSAIAVIKDSIGSADMIFRTSNTNAAASEKMRITGAGNVGIGVSTPFGKLSVSVDASAPTPSGSMTSNLVVHNTGVGRAIQLGINESSAYNYIQSAYVNNADTGTPLAVFIGNAERARFTINGLTFNGDTAAANALDDYEEGTWTPTFGATITTSGTPTGKYTKVGRTVYTTCTFTYTNLTGADINISGLPFTNGANRQATVNAYSGIVRTSNQFLGIVVEASANNFYLEVVNPASSVSLTAHASCWYQV